MTLDLFVVCAPGLEGLAAAELRDLGLEGRPVHGGVELQGTLETAARLNLWLRTASRVLVRLGAVKATSFPELIKRARTLPFELCLRRDKGAPPVALRVTCRKSRLYHSDAVAERLHAAIEARLGGPVAQAQPPSDDDGDESQLQPQMIVARFERDLCTVSADASGPLLHRRGYRAQGGKAPLRETLAAALLLATGWRGRPEDGPFFDPLCGSGTIPIEAASLARRRAPGLHRTFALQRWPAFAAPAWQRLIAEAKAGELPASPVAIAGSDQDAGAIAIANANAEAAGCAADVRFEQRPLSLAEPPPGSGQMVANAPYGVRVGANADLGRLFRDLGDLARGKLRGWRLAVLVGDRNITSPSRLTWQRTLAFENGGIKVELLAARA